MMNEKPRRDTQREDERREKLKKERKIKRENNIEKLRQVKSGAKIHNIEDPAEKETPRQKEKRKKGSKPQTNTQTDNTTKNENVESESEKERQYERCNVGIEWRGPLLKTGDTSQDLDKPTRRKEISTSGSKSVQQDIKLFENCPKNSETVAIQTLRRLEKRKLPLQGQKRKIEFESMQKEMREEEGGLQESKVFKKLRKENQKFGNEKNGGAKSQVKEEPKNSSEEKFNGWKNRTEKGNKMENEG